MPEKSHVLIWRRLFEPYLFYSPGIPIPPPPPGSFARPLHVDTGNGNGNDQSESPVSSFYSPGKIPLKVVVSLDFFNQVNVFWRVLLLDGSLAGIPDSRKPPPPIAPGRRTYLWDFLELSLKDSVLRIFCLDLALKIALISARLCDTFIVLQILNIYSEHVASFYMTFYLNLHFTLSLTIGPWGLSSRSWPCLLRI